MRWLPRSRSELSRPDAEQNRLRPTRGLLLATVVTLGLVPLLYVLFVEKLGIIAWEATASDSEPAVARAPSVVEQT